MIKETINYDLNQKQKQIIIIELIIVSLLLWRYHTSQLTFENVLIYATLYVFCMAGWFYFRE